MSPSGRWARDIVRLPFMEVHERSFEKLTGCLVTRGCMRFRSGSRLVIFKIKGMTERTHWRDGGRDSYSSGVTMFGLEVKCEDPEKWCRETWSRAILLEVRSVEDGE